MNQIKFEIVENSLINSGAKFLKAYGFLFCLYHFVSFKHKLAASGVPYITVEQREKIMFFFITEKHIIYARVFTENKGKTQHIV